MTDVTVLGPHPLDGWSMKRYAQVLAAGYRAAGYSVAILAPKNTLSSKVRWTPFRKFLAYIESMIIFPLTLRGAIRNTRVHLADHSHSHLLLWPWLRKSVLVTCHDLFAVRAALGEVPEHRTRPTGVLYQKLVIAGLRRACEVICVSKTTRADVQRLLTGVPTRVVPNPLGDTFATRAVRSASDDFALVVSSSGWRKRREYAISIWRALRTAEPARDVGLVIVGQPLTYVENESAGPDAPFIKVASGLGDEELRQLYADAAFLIQASRYEGFGWPVIEANSQGTIAVCADEAIFREIGPWNVFVEQEGPVDWAQVLAKVGESDRDDLVARAREYSMDRFAADLATATRENPDSSTVKTRGAEDAGGRN